MAATTPGNMQLNSVIVAGYIQALLPDVLSLAKSGSLEIDTSPPFSASAEGGNTYTRRQWVQPAAGDDTPTAATDMTITALTSASEIGVIVRRGKAYGIEDLAAIAGGTTVPDWDANVAKIVAHEMARNAELRFLTHMLPGLFNQTNGVLKDSAVNNSGNLFDWSMVTQANALLGEAVNALTICHMHPSVYWGAKLQDQLDMKPNYADPNAYAAVGASFAGMIGPVSIYLNERLYNSGGDYYTLMTAPNALYMGIQLDEAPYSWYDPLLAGGTNLVRYRTAYSPHIKGASFTGTAPTVIGGATDAALALATNWTAKTGYDVKENPAVVIIATAV